MTHRFPYSKFFLPIKLKKLPATLFTAAILLVTALNPVFAADPFRTKDQRNIGNNTEAVFNAVFLKGDYQTANSLLEQALTTEANEPLLYAMRASLAYTNKDIAGLESYSQQTLKAAEKLMETDKLRGNLYAAVGEFLGGAVILSRQGTVNGAPQALSKLRKVYEYLDKAEAVSPQDPELNLIKGYMDLMLAVNLPFADPAQAIQRLEKNAAPTYLVDRGIAIAYRDMKQYPKALDYAEKALKATSDNPEVYYLKAQILREKAKKDKNPQLMRDAVNHFDKALTKKNQLPAGLVKQIERERGNADKSINNLGK
ncbi:Sll0314/Alr1548 family TPR repeat-containing protein [Calothrix sp. UHCC 0171]|uniref:Sll0314/Alr1548 family TPR repeat-containing protein n=1 Tax=Calothrix sp. UHCC 0171 TaxID=3110245 RepID=UPI002B1FEEC4|nr:Sll0314/Alr1548 family TPR repeat-containing protein [Calothrix sp. UHCC 0171]MEA5569737.1 Sll0314/Alr1548 family TPR repeat-containing protein [Calothrix sp. UHCC 0171]